MTIEEIIEEFNTLIPEEKIPIYERALIRQSEYSGYKRSEVIAWAMGYLKSKNGYVKRPNYEYWILGF